MAEMATPQDVATSQAERIGREYVESDSLPAEGTERCAVAYERVAGVVRTLFDQIPVPVEFQSDDPYTDYQDMAETVGRERVLRVYNQHTEHPHFSHDDQLKFRAVHDWHGHLMNDVNFTPLGEYEKFRGMRHYFGPEENRVLFAEVVGQIGAVHYLPDGFADERYEQRAFLAPHDWMSWMSLAR